jgi:hypothetical protein
LTSGSGLQVLFPTVYGDRSTFEAIANSNSTAEKHGSIGLMAPSRGECLAELGLQSTVDAMVITLNDGDAITAQDAPHSLTNGVLLDLFRCAKSDTQLVGGLMVRLVALLKGLGFIQTSNVDAQKKWGKAATLLYAQIVSKEKKLPRGVNKQDYLARVLNDAEPVYSIPACDTVASDPVRDGVEVTALALVLVLNSLLVQALLFHAQCDTRDDSRLSVAPIDQHTILQNACPPPNPHQVLSVVTWQVFIVTL